MCPSASSTEPLVVGALVVDEQDRLFVQRRSENRELFPGCWDIVGGKVEPGETLSAALRREVAEETGWQVTRVVAALAPRTWDVGGSRRLEIDFLVEVTGDLRSPCLEQGKHTDFAWLSARDGSFLDEILKRSPSSFIADLVCESHQFLSTCPAHARRTLTKAEIEAVGVTDIENGEESSC